MLRVYYSAKSLRINLTWGTQCIVWLFLKTCKFRILTEMFLLIQAKFDAARHGPQVVGAGPDDIRGPSMYIASSYDFGCKTWTHESPSQQVTFCSHLIYFLSRACRLKHLEVSWCAYMYWCYC